MKMSYIFTVRHGLYFILRMNDHCLRIFSLLSLTSVKYTSFVMVKCWKLE
jgi:hypothetical protein